MATFTDDFNRADSTNLGANWVEESGDWSIASNQLANGNTGATMILRAAGAMATNDNSAQVTIATTAAVSHGVWCRGNTGITSGYLWRNDGASWDLFSVVSSTFTVIGTYAAAAANGDVAKVQAVGSMIKGFVNGIERVSVTNTAVATGTSVGIRAVSAAALRFDDFTGADVTSGSSQALTPATSTETAQTLTRAKAASLGLSSVTHTAQALPGAKTAALGTATAADTAQTLSRSKTSVLGSAATSSAAQPVSGAKSGVLGTLGTAETAQALAGSKTSPLATATVIEQAQGLTGSKTSTLGLVLELPAAQALTAAKTASLPGAAETDVAQALGIGSGGTLLTALTVEIAQPLTGSKTNTLGVSAETIAARLLAAPGTDEDIDILVGAPRGTWSAGTPSGHGWEVGAPC